MERRGRRALAWLLVGLLAGYALMQWLAVPERPAEHTAHFLPNADAARGLVELDDNELQSGAALADALPTRSSVSGVVESSAKAELVVRVGCGPSATPVAGALLILLLDPEGSRSLELREQTGADGTAVFRELSPGVGLLGCAHAGMQRVQLEPGARSVVVFATGEDSLRIEVVDDLDRPVGDATVFATAGNVTDVGFEMGATDTGGILKLDCTARSRGWYACAPNGSCSPIEFDYEIPETEPVRLRVQIGGTRIEGRVVDSSGLGVAGAELVLSFSAGFQFDARAIGTALEWPTQRMRTSADGRFRCTAPPNATGRLTVDAEDFAKRELRLDARTQPELEIRIERPASMTAVVRELDGVYVEGAHVFVRGEISGRPLVEGRTGTDGRCELRGLAPGTHTVEIVGTSKWRNKREVQLDAGMNAEVEFELPGGVDVKVEVVDTHGGPPTGTFKAVLRGRAPIDETPRNVTVDSAGRARFESTPPGEYILELVAADPRLRLLPRDVVVGSERVALRFELPAAKDCDGRVRGACTDSGGAPIGEVQVTLEDPDSRGMRRRYSDPRTGTFEFADLPAGTYQLYLSAPGRVARSLRDLDVSAVGVLDLGNLELSASARLAARVGETASGVKAELRLERGGLSEIRSIVVRPPLVPELDLEPGRYVLVCYGSNVAPELRELDLAAGAFTRVEIVPKPGLEVALRFDAGRARGAMHRVSWSVRDIDGHVLLHGHGQTDMRGRAAARVGLAAGTYALEAELEGEQSANTAEFEVVQGAVTEFELRLP